MEKKQLKLDHIKITPELVETINSLQVGGSLSNDIPPDEEKFVNWYLNELLKDLTSLNDLLIMVHNYDESIITTNVCMQHLINIGDLKRVLSGLAAPQTEKQSSNN